MAFILAALKTRFCAQVTEKAFSRIRLSGESSSGQDVHFEQLLVLASSKYEY